MKTFSFKFTTDCLLSGFFLSLIWSVFITPSTTLGSNQPDNTTAAKPTPENVADFQAVGQNESSITLQWTKIPGILDYTLKFNKEERNISVNGSTAPAQYTVTNLNSSTQYNFTLFTVSGVFRSTGVDLKAATTPKNVADFKAVVQNESSITLQWKKIPNILDYTLKFNGGEKNFTEPNAPAQYTVTNLNSGTQYNFTLFTVSGGVRSTGVYLKVATVPDNVRSVEVVSVITTSVTLQWDKVDNISQYVLYFYNNGSKVEHVAWNTSSPVKYTASHLTAGQKYNMTLYTYFGGLNSTGYPFNASTAPENVADFKAVDQNESSITLQWTKIPDILDYTLKFNEEEKNFTAAEHNGTYTLTHLTSGTQYNLILYTVLEGVRSTGANLTAVTAPRNAEAFRSVNQNETSITLKWDREPNIFYTIKSNTVEKNLTENQVTVSELTSGTLYDFTLFAVFENVRSSGIQLQAATAPRDVVVFKNSNQTENSITLEWEKVDKIEDYSLKLNEKINKIPASQSTFTWPGLQSGTLYSFTLFTNFANIPSSGKTFSAATVPSAVSLVKVTERTLNKITLEWENQRKDWTYMLNYDGITQSVTPNNDSNIISYSVLSLKPGWKYVFQITTQFYKLNSPPCEKHTVTVIDCALVNWHVTTSSINGVVEGAFTNATAQNGSQLHVSSGSNTVSFTGLYPGATYNMMLMYEDLEQCSHNLTIIPPQLTAECKNWAGGYSIYVVWDKPNGVWDSVEVTVSNQVHKIGPNEQHVEIPNFQPARKYEVSLSTKSGPRRSDPYVFMCATDARGVIAGSIIGVLLFGLLICVFIYIVSKRPDIIRRKKPFIGGSLRRAIPVVKFPSHFEELSADDNRGFSLEYENLSNVGIEQTQKAAHIPENKAKNRFVNVLPYDCSRVRLSSSHPHSDYINASYMPGYNNIREYIAAQGPMPSTVNDFWQMVWQQNARCIVMVTNCTEGGRTKCEQYWPANTGPSVCGDLLVYTTSEQEEADWTLRDFVLKHKRNSEERSIRHFHFTAWPDHGVPLDTKVLIRFRALVRHYIETEAARMPTVVHCSAGVGRTGTIIALDVLLQQLGKEKAVDIKGFVHKMRQNRPLMVQTESQYVFLHQCIMDSLHATDKNDEHVYENVDLIYANATALTEFYNNQNNNMNQQRA